MKKLAAILSLPFVALVFASSDAPADVGSCYSPQPICIGMTHPVCICTITLQCFWACR